MADEQDLSDVVGRHDRELAEIGRDLELLRSDTVPQLRQAASDLAHAMADLRVTAAVLRASAEQAEERSASRHHATEQVVAILDGRLSALEEERKAAAADDRAATRVEAALTKRQAVGLGAGAIGAGAVGHQIASAVSWLLSHLH